MKVAGGSSLRTITAWLREKEVCGSRGELIGLATVQRMLTDPFYAGLIKDECGQWQKGKHEPIVDQNLFARVQRQLLTRRCQSVKPSETP